MTKGSKIGSQYERDTSVKLSLWWTQNLDKPRDDIFWRTSGSGTRSTSRTKKGKKTSNEYGDVKFIDPIGKPFIDCFLIECKRGYTKEIDVLYFFQKNFLNNYIFHWWNKALKEMKQAGRKNYLVIISRQHREEVVCLNNEFFKEQFDYSGKFKGKIIEFKCNKTLLIIMKFNDFLNWVQPEDIIARMEKER